MLSKNDYTNLCIRRLMSKQLGLLEDALATFLSLDAALPDSPDILYQVSPASCLHA
jgi:hypothetical protein